MNNNPPKTKSMKLFFLINVGNFRFSKEGRFTWKYFKTSEQERSNRFSHRCSIISTGFVQDKWASLQRSQHFQLYLCSHGPPMSLSAYYASGILVLCCMKRFTSLRWTGMKDTVYHTTSCSHCIYFGIHFKLRSLFWFWMHILEALILGVLSFLVSQYNAQSCYFCILTQSTEFLGYMML